MRTAETEFRCGSRRVPEAVTRESGAFPFELKGKREKQQEKDLTFGHESS
jgi:hypothetical protein